MNAYVFNQTFCLCRSMILHFISHGQFERKLNFNRVVPFKSVGADERKLNKHLTSPSPLLAIVLNWGGGGEYRSNFGGRAEGVK